MARPRDKLKIILVQRLKSCIKTLSGQTPPVTCCTERIEIETRVIIACSYKKRSMRWPFFVQNSVNVSCFFLHGVLSWDFTLRGLPQLLEQRTPQIGLVGSMPFPGYEWQFIPEIWDEAPNVIGRVVSRGKFFSWKSTELRVRDTMGYFDVRILFFRRMQWITTP